MAKTELEVDIEQEAIVRSVGRTCRGPLSEEDREEVNRLLAEGDTVEAQKVDKAGRTDCGYDFNDTILSNELDGLEHEYECPDCGLTGIYIAPLFDE